MTAHASWPVELPGTLADIELRFARSRRRAASRRLAARRPVSRNRVLRGIGVAAALFASAAALGVQVTAEAERTAPPQRPTAEVTTLPCPIPARFRPAFLAAARRTGLSLSLLTAVARVESRMDPAARSEAGAQGLLQLMPATAAALAADPAVPAANVLAGARYLRRLLDRFGSLDLALAAYNAGPTAVARAGGAPTASTLTYVANVEAIAASLGDCG